MAVSISCLHPVRKRRPGADRSRRPGKNHVPHSDGGMPYVRAGKLRALAVTSLKLPSELVPGLLRRWRRQACWLRIDRCYGHIGAGEDADRRDQPPQPGDYAGAKPTRGRDSSPSTPAHRPSPAPGKNLRRRCKIRYRSADRKTSNAASVYARTTWNGIRGILRDRSPLSLSKGFPFILRQAQTNEKSYLTCTDDDPSPSTENRLLIPWFADTSST